MKYIRVYFVAIVLAACIAFPSVSTTRLVHAQAPPPSQKDKSKKPNAEEGGQDDQVIKLGTQLVTVPFNVTDKKNKYINDLTKADIDIFEDSKPQQVFSFERQTDLPITIAMLIDISGSEQFTLPTEVSAGKKFFRRVLRAKKDLAAVVTFEGEAELVQGLTSDASKLQRALDDVRISVPSASVSSVGTPPINGNSRAGSTAIWDALFSVSSDLLAPEAGRRVIVLITDGEDTSSRLKMKDAIERTWRNEVIIYAIGIGGPDGVDSGVLKKVTFETGGRAFFPRNTEADLETAFAQIDEDLRSQYILAYQPGNESKDGSFRTIQVKIKNHADLTVRHRRGYFAPSPKGS